MSKRLALLNLLLVGMSGLLVYQVHEVWNGPLPNLSALGRKPIAEINSRKALPIHPSDEDFQRTSPAPPPPIEAYQIIGQTNPFRPDREEWIPPPPPPPPAAVVPPKPALPPPNSFRLYGTLRMPDGSAVALIEGPLGFNPSKPSPSMRRRSPAPPPPSGGKSKPGRARRYRMNDLIGGYRIVEIRRDRVVMDGEGLKVEVLLRDPNAPKPRLAALPQFRAAPAFPRPTPPPRSGSPAPASQPSSDGGGVASAPALQPGVQSPPRRRNRQIIQTPFGPKVIYR
ncbi:MAG: hypothetical protein HYY20_13460 [Candidatus Tectomicrobia bacterium]|uniref:Uncharacterized protein n=1 Tax=Tectimicrobiota bacterium TaxID=2528274 RepID=A0A932CR70_UNCTE|nr:hypothetical protein [Candidatus Tectomicrobia bacterium]